MYVELTTLQVALAASLILINGAVSLALQLRIERPLLISAVRMVVQLTLVGMVLEWVFRVDRWYLVIGLAAVMTTIAGFTAVQRIRRRYAGMWINTLVSIWVTSWVVAAFALMVVVQGEGREHWYQPQYSIPLLGMILGNSLNGITLGLNAFTESLADRRDEVEAALALGATRWEAARGPVQNAVRTGMIPIVNTMAVAGLVSLPGMMTGQLLSGVNPIEAVKYQIVIMFLLGSVTAMGTVGVVLLSFRRLFSVDHEFLYHRLTRLH